MAQHSDEIMLKDGSCNAFQKHIGSKNHLVYLSPHDLVTDKVISAGHHVITVIRLFTEMLHKWKQASKLKSYMSNIWLYSLVDRC